MPDVHDQTSCGVLGGGDELGGQPEVGDVGEPERLQGHSGADVGGLGSQLVELGCPLDEVGQGRDDTIDNTDVGPDLDLSGTEDLGGVQQRPPFPVRVLTACAARPLILEQLDLAMDQAQVVADPRQVIQPVGCLAASRSSMVKPIPVKRRRPRPRPERAGPAG